MVKDGWHIVSYINEFDEEIEYEVLVENGVVLRGIKEDRNGYPVTAYPYRACKSGGYDNVANDVKYSTFRKGLKTGLYILA